MLLIVMLHFWLHTFKWEKHSFLVIQFTIHLGILPLPSFSIKKPGGARLTFSKLKSELLITPYIESIVYRNQYPVTTTQQLNAYVCMSHWKVTCLHLWWAQNERESFAGTVADKLVAIVQQLTNLQILGYKTSTQCSCNHYEDIAPDPGPSCA